MFKKFTAADDKDVVINVNHVSEIEYVWNSYSCKTLIRMTNGSEVYVQEDFSDVVKTITDNQVQVDD